MNIYILLPSQNECKIPESQILAIIIQEGYHILSFYILIFGITYFFWISKSEINNKKIEDLKIVKILNNNMLKIQRIYKILNFIQLNILLH